jgi:hypothetical protein
MKSIDKPFMAVMLVEKHDGTFPQKLATMQSRSFMVSVDAESHPDFSNKVKWVMLRAPRKAWRKFQDPEFLQKVNDKFWNKKYWNR